MGIQTLSGLIVGGYELRDLIGRGGMAAVYRGHQLSLRRDVAIKVLPLDLAQQSDYVQRFFREAEVAARLEHPNIVPIYDYGNEQGVTYVAMRLLTGGTLADRIAHQARQHLPLPSLREIAILLKQLGSALDYAHRNGVIHRDIKPSNVMFDEQGTAFLVDFGIAKLLESTGSLTNTGLTMGTPLYMSPEQWRADQPLTQAADQYALAVKPYALLIGHPPFEAPTPYALMHKHLNEIPPAPHLLRPDLPPAVAQVLARALAKNPADRFSSVGEFAGAFEQAVGGMDSATTNFFVTPLPLKVMPTPPRIPTATRPYPLPYRVSQQSNRNGIMLLVAVLAILGIGGMVLIVMALSSGGGDDDTPDTPVAQVGGVSTDDVNVTVQARLEATQTVLALVQIDATATALSLQQTAQAQMNATGTALSLQQTAQARIVLTQNAQLTQDALNRAATQTAAAQIAASQTAAAKIAAASAPLGGGHGEILYTTGDDNTNYDFYILSPSGGSPRRVSSESFDEFAPAWSPDGSRFAFVAAPSGNEDIFVMDAQGNARRQLTSTDCQDWSPSWSPDGRTLVFNSRRDGNAEIYLMDTDGNNIRRLTNTAEADTLPDWSPDGRKITFVSARDGDAEIYVMNADGSSQTRLTTSPGDDSLPTWSPDGKKIAFLSVRDNAGAFEIYVMDADGSDQTRLTFNEVFDGNIDWSPDGQWIVFSSHQDDFYDLYLMRTDGSDVRRLTNNAFKEYHPDWRP